MVGVGHLGEFASSIHSSIGHQRTHIAATTHDDDACMGHLGLPLGRHIVGVFAQFLFFLHRLFHLTFFHHVVGGMKGHVVVGEHQPLEVLDLHAQGHEALTVGLTVAEPRRYLTGPCALGQLAHTPFWELGQVALLHLRVFGAGKRGEDDGGGYEDHAHHGDVDFVVHGWSGRRFGGCV